MTAATLERQPFLGVDSKPATRKYKPWKHSTRDTLGTIQHVMLNDLTYRDGGLTFRFWSLAPTVVGKRRGRQITTHEFVWLIFRTESSAYLYHALVNRETGEIAWRDNGQRHYS